MTPVKRRVLNISALVAAFGVAATICVAFLHAGRWSGQVQGNTDRIEVHEKKIHAIEETVTETHSDVQWIRQLMEKEHP